MSVLQDSRVHNLGAVITDEAVSPRGMVSRFLTRGSHAPSIPAYNKNIFC